MKILLFLPALLLFILPVISYGSQEAENRAKEEVKAMKAENKKKAKSSAAAVCAGKQEDAAQIQEPAKRRGRPRKSQEPEKGADVPDLPTTCTLEEFAAWCLSA